MAQELERLTKHGYLERATELTEECFEIPAVITVKKDKSVKIALDSRKLNDVTVKRKAQIPNMEETKCLSCWGGSQRGVPGGNR